MWYRILACCILLGGAFSLERKDYTGYKVIDVFTATNEHVKYLETLQLTHHDLDFWREPRRMTGGHQGTVLVPPGKLDEFIQMMVSNQIQYQIRPTDVQKQIDDEYAHFAATQGNHNRLEASQFAFSYNAFNNTYEMYMTGLDDMVARCPAGVTCTLSTIGTSHEGNAIKRLVLSTGAGRKSYWVDSLIHAREWLAGATLMNVMNHMVTNYGSDSTITSLLDTYDFHFVPLVNPDGYIYSYLGDRYWRKNRTPDISNPNCPGTDLNRNFDYLWGQEGVEHKPCSDIYCGLAAASEFETQAVQNAITSIGASNTMAMITIHSYAYVWLFPFSDTVGGSCWLAADHDDLMAVANAAADATQNTHNTNTWNRGNGCVVLGAITGATDEWAKGAAGIKYAYTIELRGDDFIIDPSHIELSFQEIWNGLVAFGNAVSLNPPA